MKKISPTNDLMFKKIFGSPENSHILKGFIKDLLGLEVTDVTVLNPYNIRKFLEARRKNELIETEVDVLARVDEKALVTIEMQVAKEFYFAERSVHYVSEKYASNYACKVLGNQPDNKYSSLQPVYGINILDFNLFDDEDAIHEFGLYDREHEKYLLSSSGQPLIKMIYLELKKAKGQRKQLLRYWIKFFVEGKADRNAPDYIKDAARQLDYENLDQEEREMMDALERGRADWIDRLEYAKYEGIQEGVQKGIQKGLNQGLQQGKVEDARRMLAEGLDIELIQRITGFSLDDISKLK